MSCRNVFVALLAIVLSVFSLSRAQAQVQCDVEPADIVIMMDRTSSVTDDGRTAQVTAVNTLLQSFNDLGSQHSVGIGRFNDDTPALDPAAEIVAPLSQDYIALQAVVAGSMLTQSAGTNIADAINVGRAELETGINSKKILILISDGEPSRPSIVEGTVAAIAAADAAKLAGIRILTLGFEADTLEGRDLLAQLASGISLNDAFTNPPTSEEINTENNDGDDYFISPALDQFELILNQIGTGILCIDTCVPTEEICDGVDNDCDNIVDNVIGLGDSCGAGVGACAQTGELVCSENGLVCNVSGGIRTTEVCDGIDNDCDGEIDNNPIDVGQECGGGVGACAQTGVTVCTPNGVACNISVTEPTTEVCDGIDNDCDGKIDNDPVDVGQECSAGVGACAQTGVTVCTPNGISCNASVTEPTIEICDGIDNNCNEEIDEGLNCSTDDTPNTDDQTDITPTNQQGSGAAGGVLLAGDKVMSCSLSNHSAVAHPSLVWAFIAPLAFLGALRAYKLS